MASAIQADSAPPPPPPAPVSGRGPAQRIRPARPSRCAASEHHGDFGRCLGANRGPRNRRTRCDARAHCPAIRQQHQRRQRGPAATPPAPPAAFPSASGTERSLKCPGVRPGNGLLPRPEALVERNRLLRIALGDLKKVRQAVSSPAPGRADLQLQSRRSGARGDF